jgi:UDP-2,4-diacetamido-2,4,6-trideoxy-beta-L-altropyranose hydrolase
MARTLLLRTDASAEIGAGHAMRCLGLAEAWRRAGGNVVFAMAERLEHIDAAVRSVGRVEPVDALCGSDEDVRLTLGAAQRHDAACIVVDGYRFTEAYLRDVSGGDSRTMAVDDTASLSRYDVDVILNENLGASPSEYEGKTAARLLLGTDYLLLREMFLAWADRSRPTPDLARELLVTLGGGCSGQSLAAVLDAVGRVRVPGFGVTVVGDVDAPTAELGSGGDDAPNVRFRGTVADMAAAMASADIAVSGGGVSSLELAFMGVPSVTLVLSEDQARNAVGLDAAGVAIDAGPAGAIEPAALAAVIESLCRDGGRRARMRASAQALVDGRGADRVAGALMEMIAG